MRPTKKKLKIVLYTVLSGAWRMCLQQGVLLWISYLEDSLFCIQDSVKKSMWTLNLKAHLMDRATRVISKANDSFASLENLRKGSNRET